MKRKSFWLTLLISLLLSAAIGTVLLSLGRLEPTAISAAAWDSIAKVGKMLPLIGMTILVALGLYTFSLFCFKPQETYLREFLIFQGVILLRYMAWYLHLFPLSWEVRRWISPAITWTIALLILKISVLLSGTRLSGFWKKALSWPWLLIWGTVLFLLWPQEGTSRHFRNLTVFLISLVFLCQGSSQKERGVRWCLAGMVILLGVYYSMIANYFVEQHNPLFYYLNRLYFIDVPFILGTMVCVNSKFAWAFTEKERLSANLEEMVEERTRQIKELQAERHSMITNIFHDLRTPLFVIGNGLEVLESNPEALPEMLPILQQRSHFAKELTEDLFLLIKLQDGKVVLSQQRVPLSDIVSSLSSSLPEIVARPDMTVISHVEPDLFVWGDPIRLQQIFQNLILNAVHYTPEGGRVEIVACRKGEEYLAASQAGKVDADRKGDLLESQNREDFERDGTCVVSIKDSGTGISEEDAAHIFERYFHTNESHKHDSSGLGLSIARELVNLHHGQIFFTSAPGEGTTFTVELPLC